METKVIRKFFGLADFLDEQRFLEEQNRIGWKFQSFHSLNKYTFEQCEPNEYVYRLDYNQDDKDENEYIQIYNDCGWEYIMKYQTWYYFRKMKSKVNQADNEIFSDRYSKVEMIKKIMWKQLFVLIPILLFFSIFLPSMSRILQENLAFRIVWIFYSLIMALLLGLCIHNVIKLNKLIQEVQNPLDE